MRLFEGSPGQHRTCHRSVWKISGIFEQRARGLRLDPTPSGNTIVLMRDVYRLSGRQPFNHLNSGRKLASLLTSHAKSFPATAPENLAEAVALHRSMFYLDQSRAESVLVSNLEAALGLLFDVTSSLDVLRERVALTRQQLFLEPGESQTISHLSDLLLICYERTSEADLLYESQSLSDERTHRESSTDPCPVLDQMEAEFQELSILQDVDQWMIQHQALARTSSVTHAACSERLSSLVVEMKARGAVPEDPLPIAREATRLVNRGIGISNQLRALNMLFVFLMAQEPRRTEELYFTLQRLRSLVADSDHRITDLSWIACDRPLAEGKHRPIERHDPTAYHTAARTLDATAQLESERTPALQWVNPMLLSYNSRARQPALMVDYQAYFQRQADELGDVDTIPEGSPERAKALTVKALTVLASSHKDDLDFVIETLKGAVQCWGLPLDQPIPSGHFMRWTLTGLSHAFYMRHRWSDAVEDIEMAVQTMRHCLDGASQPQDYMPHLGALASALEARYRRLGNVKNIQEAFELASVVLKKRSEGQTDVYIGDSWKCGRAAESLFEAIGGITLLDYAASCVRRGIRLASEEHPLMPVLLSRLGSILRKRFLHLQMPSDLAVAQEIAKNAIGLQEKKNNVDHDLSNNRAIYGEIMLARFESDLQQEHLDKALSLFQLILQESDKTASDLANANYQLGNALYMRNETNDVAVAISYLRKTLEIQPDTRRSRYPVWATALSMALSREFEQSSDPVAIQEANSLSETATFLIPDTHTARADIYAQLGEVKYKIFLAQHQVEDLEGCLLAFHTAASSKSSPHPGCLKYTRRWEDIALEHNHQSLWSALDASLAHQTKLAGIGLSIKARHEYLTKNPLPASKAAARAIRQGNLERAVEYLEHGRSVLWRQTLELRSSLEGLHAVSPSLANQLAAIVEELDGNAKIQSITLNPSTSWGGDDPDQIRRYNRELAEQYDSVLHQIRKLKGFGDFLRLFQFSDTAGISADGPVVIFNLCEEGCDALVLVDSGVEHISLPEARFDTLLQAGSQIRTAGARVEYDQGAEMGSLLPPILRLLWTSLVDPILKFFRSRGSVPKRVFWCVAGISELPIHAAGLYVPGTVNLPDILVSSYIPTISALIRARKAKSHYSTGQPRLLAVAQTNAAGFASLPFAVAEVSVLKQLEVVTTELIDEESTPEAVLSQLRTHNWAHLCCHGTTNAQLPLLSAFHLGNSLLTIESIMRADLPTADFVFLGACHSAEGSAAQSESMSLASAMQVAGFRSIVATMYAIRDEDGPTVARELYEYLFRYKQGTADSSEAAAGLNRAVRALRRAKVPVHRWVRFLISTISNS